MVMHVALGWEYRGRKIAQGPVVYVACEGEQGLSARIEAFRQDRLQETGAGIPFFLVTTRLDLAAEAQQLCLDIAAQVGTTQPITATAESPSAPACIVIDTLNRSLAGSESKDEDMAAYVAGADYLRAQFKAAVILIHHCGINDARPRGHSSLTGAADAQLAVKRDAAGQVVLTVEWMKDGPEGDVLTSRLKILDLGADEDGEAVSSCVIEPGDGVVRGLRADHLTPAQKVALDKLDDCAARLGIPMVSSYVPTGAIVVTLDAWRDALRAADLIEAGDKGRQTWKRLKEKLQSIGKIGIFDSHVWSNSSDRDRRDSPKSPDVTPDVTLSDQELPWERP
jgi:hypothetical protein